MHTQSTAMPPDIMEQVLPEQEEPLENPTFCQRVNLFFSRWNCCNGNDIVPRGADFPIPSFSNSFSLPELGSLPSLPSMDVDCGDAIGACGDLIEPCCEALGACCIN